MQHNTSISHRQEVLAIMLELEIFVFESFPVNRLASGSVSTLLIYKNFDLNQIIGENLPISEITALNHEFLDDSMKTGALIVEPSVPIQFLTSTKEAEVFSSFGDYITIETKNEASSILAINVNVEVGLGRNIGSGNK